MPNSSSWSFHYLRNLSLNCGLPRYIPFCYMMSMGRVEQPALTPLPGFPWIFLLFQPSSNVRNYTLPCQHSAPLVWVGFANCHNLKNTKSIEHFVKDRANEQLAIGLHWTCVELLKLKVVNMTTLQAYYTTQGECLPRQVISSSSHFRPKLSRISHKPAINLISLCELQAGDITGLRWFLGLHSLANNSETALGRGRNLAGLP